MCGCADVDVWMDQLSGWDRGKIIATIAQVIVDFMKRNPNATYAGKKILFQGIGRS